MNLGDKVTIPFGKSQKEGTIVRMYEKNVWVKVDFPRHPGKLIRRKLSDLTSSGSKKKARKSK